jgi:hypothetical protein
VLGVAEEMPTVHLAVSLPDCSSLIKDVNQWMREFEQVRRPRAWGSEELTARSCSKQESSQLCVFNPLVPS